MIMSFLKKLVKYCAAALVTVSAFAQTPEKMSYQAVIRNANNNLVVNTSVNVKVSILQGSSIGTPIYEERHTTFTNANGLITLEIGEGTILSWNDFATINWSNGPYFINTITEPTVGNDFSISAISQLLSVPYALYAKTSGSCTPGPQGPAGNDGSSAYEIAVNNGFVGTEAQWLASLVGPQGLTGAQGPSGASGPQGPVAPGSFTRYIGEQFGGGIIFHLWKDNLGIEHGLIVALNNQSITQNWSNVTSTPIGTSAESSWDGLSNSNAIVNQAGHTNSAAKLCLDLISGGQSDWYLPSIDELSILWHNRFNVNRSLSAIGTATPLSRDQNYWASTERFSNNAHVFVFDLGYVDGYGKSNTNVITRAIRAF